MISQSGLNDLICLGKLLSSLATDLICLRKLLSSLANFEVEKIVHL